MYIHIKIFMSIYSRIKMIDIHTHYSKYNNILHFNYTCQIIINKEKNSLQRNWVIRDQKSGKSEKTILQF